MSGCAGAAGGLLASMNPANHNSISLVGKVTPQNAGTKVPREIYLGFIGDLLVGAAAGVAIVFFLGITAAHADEPVPPLRLIPIGLMAGVVSKKALAGMSEAVIGKLVSETQHIREQQASLQNKLQNLDHVNELIQEGERYLKDGEAEKDAAKRAGIFRLARDTFLTAIEVDHIHPVAYVCLGKALKRLAREANDNAERLGLFREAIQATSEAIKLNPAYDRAFYNRACYKALMEADISDILDDLAKAIQLFSTNRVFAQSDPDFASIASNPNFISTVAGEEPSKGAAG